VDKPDQQRDFFVSYSQADRAWAEWLAWELEAAGHTTVLQAWDMPAGTACVHAMDQVVQATRHVVLVLSPAYLRSGMSEAEWRPGFKADPSGEAAVGAYVDAMEVDWADREDRSAPTGPGPG
jgi:TIR domain